MIVHCDDETLDVRQHADAFQYAAVRHRWVTWVRYGCFRTIPASTVRDFARLLSDAPPATRPQVRPRPLLIEWADVAEDLRVNPQDGDEPSAR